jgi:hypothetical protein
MNILQRIRERAYQLWEEEGRPEGRDVDHWLNAEHELLNEATMSFEFTQLMRGYRDGRISETVVEQVMRALEEKALSNGTSYRAPAGNSKAPSKSSDSH